MKLINDYFEAKQAIYNHVGFEEDYVIYPIDDQTEMYWTIDDEEVVYHEEKQGLIERDGNHYSAEIYKQHFYNKWVYEGEDFTMIFLNPGVDGMKYFALFDNNKKIDLA